MPANKVQMTPNSPASRNQPEANGANECTGMGTKTAAFLFMGVLRNQYLVSEKDISTSSLRGFAQYDPAVAGI
jgi:hypothetical protein